MSSTISVHLEDDNLRWLKTQAKASGGRALSDTLNSILSRLRLGSGEDSREEPPFRAKINEADPDLKEADAAIRSLYARSLEQTAELLKAPEGMG
jgi:hypothetical protein